MALVHRKPPSASEAQDFRAKERFDEDTYHCLKLVGTVTTDIGSISAGAIATFTIPVMGAKIGFAQQVFLAAPSTIEAGLTWCGFVSAADVVTVRVHNTTGSPINPASGLWGARVLP